MATVPTTEQLINEDGVLDEKAAGQVIDDVVKETQDETTPKADEKPAKDDDDATVDDEPDGDDWVSTDDIRELVESLGYSEEDMSEFGDQDEFERHVRLLDREIVKRERTRPGDEQERALEADELSRQKDVRSQQVKNRYRENGKFAKAPVELPRLDPDEYEEQLVDAIDARDEYLAAELRTRDAEIAELRQMIQDSSQNSILQDFDRIVDDLGHDDLFGNSEDLKPNERKQRSELFEEYKDLFNYLESRGKSVTDSSVNRGIVLRAFNLKFADEIKKKTRRDLTSKVKRQSARRTGSARRQSKKVYDGPLEKDPDLIQAFRNMESENG